MQFQGIELVCPRCRGDLEERGGPEPDLRCGVCDRAYPIILGIPDLRIYEDPYIDLEADRAKGRMLAERTAEMDFAAAVDLYYSVTPAVTPRQARQFGTALMAAEERARDTLDGWEVAAPEATRRLSLLDVGSGSGPLLVAAAHRYRQLVGVDLAFRWPVMARRRLADAGLEIPLICACADALPFPADRFDRIVGDGLLEHVEDQALAAREMARVGKPGGRVFLSTANRWSLGPDPATGLWAGGYLPSGWVDAYMRRQAGNPPLRRFLSVGGLRSLLRAAGLESVRVSAPDVSEAQRRGLRGGTRWLVGAYRTARSIPLLGNALRRVGPQLRAIGIVPADAGG